MRCVAFFDEAKGLNAKEMSKLHIETSSWETMKQHPKQKVIDILHPQEQDTEMVGQQPEQKERHISYFGCVAQVFLFTFFVGSDFSLLTVMAYDRYVAICNPLHYEMVMNWKACTKIMILVGVTGLVYGILHTIGTFSIPFCSNVVSKFFCEIPELLKLSCSGFNVVEVGVIVASITAALGSFILILVSYAMIFKAVLKIPSVKGRQKTFSTCFPYFIVFSMFLVSGCLAYLRPPSNTSSYLDLSLTALYSLLPPLFNPIIYSIRNKNIKSVLSKLWRF
ncbi:putative olfactory receptor 14L1 [Python bivittatus]|uniref:Olfactory receptor n=1 Tax=Python bivittatus TaxID=176946 RepID=A0A9F5J1B5_PYTBI|nr:putative olfactory receptor 14L1 [Python bivittatus]